MRFLLSLSVAMFMIVYAAFAQDQDWKVRASNPQFNALKTLAGEWKSVTPDGKTATESYRIVSADSAIILEQNMPGEPNMITMFHTDGDKLVATHYCAMGNQPRMVSEPSSDTKVIAFKFKDITNDAGKGSMRDLTIHLIDNDHHVQEWTWVGPDGKSQTEKFAYTRVKSAPAQGK